MFLSQSFCRHTFVNIFVSEAKQLKCFRFSDTDHKTIVQTSFGTISCLDAAYTQVQSIIYHNNINVFQKDKHTVVLETEHLLTLYSGHSKVCTISYPSVCHLHNLATLFITDSRRRHSYNTTNSFGHISLDFA